MDFYLLLKTYVKILVKSIRNNLSHKYSENLLDHAKQIVADAFKTASKRAIQKTVEVTGHLIGNKIADYKSFKQFKQNNSEKNENFKEIPKEIYTSPEKRPEIIDKLDINVIV